MSDLPQNWTDCRLGDVVDYGKTRKCEPDGIPEDSWVLELEDIEKGTSRLLDRQTFAQRQSKSTKNGFDAGDVLYGKLRPYLNKVLIADRPGYCTTEIVPLKAGPYLDGRYLFYWLKHPTFLAYVEAESHGLNMPRLGTDTGRAAPFVFAPRPEQTRIADKLDAVLARADSCRDRLGRIPVILKRFRQSVLVAATSGQLTEEWRDGQPTEDTWSSHSLGEYAENHDGSRVPISEVLRAKRHGIYPYYGASGVIDTIDGYTHDGKFLLIGEDGANLLTRSKPIAFVATGKIWVNNHAHVLSCRNGAPEEYLGYFINSIDLAPYVSGSAQPKLNQKNMNAIVVPVPPVAEQHEIVRRVENLFTFADRLEARYTAAQAQVEKLTPSLLSKAFRGELVPQDPNDEPASVLLERIASKRSASEIQPRRRQSTAGRKPTRAPKENAAVTKSRQDEDVQGKPYLAQHLRLLGGSASAEALFKVSELPVADFYKQLAWEVAQGHVRDGKTVLELADAA